MFRLGGRVGLAGRTGLGDILRLAGLPAFEELAGSRVFDGGAGSGEGVVRVPRLEIRIERFGRGEIVLVLVILVILLVGIRCAGFGEGIEFGTQRSDFGGQLVSREFTLGEAGPQALDGVVHGGQITVGALQPVVDDRAAIHVSARVLDPAHHVFEPVGLLGHLLLVPAAPGRRLGGQHPLTAPPRAGHVHLDQVELARARHQRGDAVAPGQMHAQLGGAVPVRVHRAQPRTVRGVDDRLEYAELTDTAAQPRRTLA